jgi:hypothetical protein
MPADFRPRCEEILTVGVAEYVLQDKRPAAFNAKLPIARQLADVVKESLPARISTPRTKKS